MLRAISCVDCTSFSGGVSGSTRFTTITTSAQVCRATSTGIFRTCPPSVRMYLSQTTGAKAPGMAMLARIAVARSP